MSNLYINIRLFSWHFQLDFDLHPSINYNVWHKANGYKDGYFRIYQFYPFV